jgi:hypothetical protein
MSGLRPFKFVSVSGCHQASGLPRPPAFALGYRAFGPSGAHVADMFLAPRPNGPGFQSEAIPRSGRAGIGPTQKNKGPTGRHPIPHHPGPTGRHSTAKPIREANGLVIRPTQHPKGLKGRHTFSISILRIPLKRPQIVSRKILIRQIKLCQKISQTAQINPLQSKSKQNFTPSGA